MFGFFLMYDLDISEQQLYSKWGVPHKLWTVETIQVSCSGGKHVVQVSKEPVPQPASFQHSIHLSQAEEKRKAKQPAACNIHCTDTRNVINGHTHNLVFLLE